MKINKKIVEKNKKKIIADNIELFDQIILLIFFYFKYHPHDIFFNRF
jgi:capsule polysaccharide export protein KpsE/RkpR